MPPPAVPPLLRLAGLIPKDRAARRIALGLPYGPDSRHRLDLYAPRNPAPELMPILIFFYGGSWSSGVREAYGFVGRALAAQGFLVAIPDYRLVPEFHFPAFVEDCAAATQYLVTHAAAWNGDGDRIILCGHSAGAYNAAMLALDPRWLGEDRERVKGLIGLAGPYDFLPLRSAITRAAFSRAPDLTRTQPINHVSVSAPPSLLLHGEQDRSVSPSNSITLAQGLRSAGAPAELILYPKLSHVSILTALSLPLRRRASVLSDLIAFARRSAEQGGAYLI